ncbi:MAG: hypothetical protein IJQ62_06450 [Clostridia bacterium]|nr:hypothetical protein [Clostridia bacterium]
MKKILALLLALVMALGCVGAFAEETASENTENTITIPSFTLSFESKADIEKLVSLLPMLGVDEATAAQMQSILPLLAHTNGQIVFANNGIQLDLGLQGQKLLTVAGEQTEDGFALASDILPSYVLTLANDTIKAIMDQFTSQAEGAMANVNMEALMTNMTGYMMQYIASVSAAVKPGEAEMGEFAFEDLDLTFNCRMPIEIDMEAIKTAVLTLMEQIKSDENVASLISALGTMGIPVETAENPEIVTPEVTVYAYSNVNEEGESDGPTLVTVETVVTAEEETVTVDVAVLVEENAVTVGVNMVEQEVSCTVHVEPTEKGAFMFCVFEGQGIEAAETLNVTIGDEIKLETEAFLMDLENAISSEVVTFAMGGERDFAVLDENKTVVPVEQLMADSEGEIAGALLGDVMSNGLGALITKVSEIMPEEVGALMTLLSGGQAAE